MADMQQPPYEFTSDWFHYTSESTWNRLIPKADPTRILEIGSYEGRSACYLIDTLASRKSIELHCVDTWAGGIEHKEWGVDMSAVESRFHHNTGLSIQRAANKVDLHCHKGCSDAMLSKLLAEGKRGYFDFIYVDGSHMAPDVLCDAVLSFRLLRCGGLLGFDDYTWSQDPQHPEHTDPIRCPKPAIDAFVNNYIRKLRILNEPLYQLYVEKVSD